MPTDEVTIKFKVDSGDAERKIKKLKDDVTKSANESEQQAKSMSESIFFGLSAIELVARASTWAMQKLTEGMDAVEATAEDISKTNFFSGISTDEIQKMQGALKKVGVDFNSFYSSYMRFQQLLAGPSVGQMPSQSQQLGFAKLGISPFGYATPEEALKATGQALLQKPVGERNMLAGMVGVDMGYLYALERGIDAFAEYNKLTEEQIKLQTKANEEMRKTDFIIEQTQQQAGYVGNRTVKDKAKRLWASFWGADYLGQLTKRERLDRGQENTARILAEEMHRAGGGEAQIRAFVGNAFAESSLQWWKENGSHKGLFQWDPSRWEKYQKWRNSSMANKILTEERAEARYAIEEMKKRHGGKSWQRFMGTVDPQETTDIWESDFEVSGRQGMATRYRGALLEPMPVGQGATAGNSTIVNDNSRKVYVNGVQVDGSTPIGNLSEAQAVGG